MRDVRRAGNRRGSEIPTQESRRRAAPMTGSSDCTGQRVPCQPCDQESDSRGVRGKGISEVMGPLPSQSRNVSLSRGQSSWHAGQLTCVLNNLRYLQDSSPVEPKYTAFRFLLSETEKGTSEPLPTGHDFTDLEKAGSPERCLS